MHVGAACLVHAAHPCGVRAQESSSEESVEDSDEDASDVDDEEDEEEEGKDWDVRALAACGRTCALHAVLIR